MIDKIVKKVKEKLLNEVSSTSSARGTYLAPLRFGKHIFKDNQLGAFTKPVSKYYSPKLATDSYDGEMSTPQKYIKQIEKLAKKSSIDAKKHPIQNDEDGDIINPFPKTKNRINYLNQSNPYNKINEWRYEEAPIITEDLNVKYFINEADSSTTAGPYTGPVELGIRKWNKTNLAPFTEFVDNEINNKKIKSSLKNNIKKIVGMWEKDKKGSYNIETGDVHTINEDLAVWFGTKKKPKGSSQPKGPWVNICRKVDGKHPPCGRSEADTKGYPKCRAVGVASKMTQGQKQAACAQKRRAEKKEPKIGTGNKPTMTSYKPKKKS